MYNKAMEEKIMNLETKYNIGDVVYTAGYNESDGSFVVSKSNVKDVIIYEDGEPSYRLSIFEDEDMTTESEIFPTPEDAMQNALKQMKDALKEYTPPKKHKSICAPFKFAPGDTAYTIKTENDYMDIEEVRIHAVVIMNTQPLEYEYLDDEENRLCEQMLYVSPTDAFNAALKEWENDRN